MTIDDATQKLELKLRMGVMDTALRALGVLAMLLITGTQTWMFTEIYHQEDAILILQERQARVTESIKEISDSLRSNHEIVLQIKGELAGLSPLRKDTNGAVNH